MKATDILQPTAEQILQQAKDEVAKKYGFDHWGIVLVLYKEQANFDVFQFEKWEDEASLLAMERIAEMVWDAGQTYGAITAQPIITILHEDLKETPDKSTYMNNLFPKI